MLRALGTCLLLCAVTGVAACGGGGGGSSAPASTGTVSMMGLRFHPDTISVRVGKRVTWRNDDAVDHNVTATAGATFHSRAFGAGSTFSFTPTRPGPISYVCTLHPGMKGTLVVRP